MSRVRTPAALVAAGAAVVLGAGAGGAYGHADVVRLTPRSGATVTQPVRVVGVRFNDSIVTGRITLTTASGRAVTPRVMGLASRRTHLRAVLRSALPDGSYRVSWRTLFNDGHRGSGSWRFRVR
jgi:methionine-rich copper-binding protein CopC